MTFCEAALFMCGAVLCQFIFTKNYGWYRRHRSTILGFNATSDASWRELHFRSSKRYGFAFGFRFDEQIFLPLGFITGESHVCVVYLFERTTSFGVVVGKDFEM